jgi:glycosyltransferase involved in cell wall biosynthesis
MRIGIDAQHLSQPLTGIGRYTWEVLKQIATNPVEIVAYLPNKPVVDTRLVPNVRFKASDFSSNIGRTFWAQTVLPYHANRDQLDVYWGPAHRLPFFLKPHLRTAVTIHDVTWKMAPETMKRSTYWLDRICMPYALERATVVMADSNCTASDLKRFQLAAPDKVHTVPLGYTQLPKPGEFHELKPLGVEDNYFLFVGTLEPRKNLHRLLMAYSKLGPTIRDQAQLVIVGGKGWGKHSLTDTIEQLDLGKRVCVLGYVDDATLSTLYKHAMFLAMPSIYEGFGLPALEAMANGLCILGSKNTSIEEISNGCGLMVDPLNDVSILDALRQLISEKHLREQLAAYSVKTTSVYEWSTCSDRILKILNPTHLSDLPQ